MQPNNLTALDFTDVKAVLNKRIAVGALLKLDCNTLVTLVLQPACRCQPPSLKIQTKGGLIH